MRQRVGGRVGNTVPAPWPITKKIKTLFCISIRMEIRCGKKGRACTVFRFPAIFSSLASGRPLQKSHVFALFGGNK